MRLMQWSSTNTIIQIHTWTTRVRRRKWNKWDMAGLMLQSHCHLAAFCSVKLNQPFLFSNHWIHLNPLHLFRKTSRDFEGPRNGMCERSWKERMRRGNTIEDRTKKRKMEDEKETSQRGITDVNVCLRDMLKECIRLKLAQYRIGLS